MSQCISDATFISEMSYFVASHSVCMYTLWVKCHACVCMYYLFARVFTVYVCVFYVYLRVLCHVACCHFVVCVNVCMLHNVALWMLHKHIWILHKCGTLWLCVCCTMLHCLHVYSRCVCMYSMYSCEWCVTLHVCMYVYFGWPANVVMWYTQRVLSPNSKQCISDATFISEMSYFACMYTCAYVCILCHYVPCMLGVLCVYSMCYVSVVPCCKLCNCVSPTLVYTLHILLPILYVAKECHYAYSVYSRYVLNSGVCFVPF